MSSVNIFTEMGEYSGQLTVVLAIISATILTRAVLAGLLDASKDTDTEEE